MPDQNGELHTFEMRNRSLLSGRWRKWELVQFLPDCRSHEEARAVFDKQRGVYAFSVEVVQFRFNGVVLK